MGDWIIQQLVNKENLSKGAADLIGKLMICDHKKVAERINVLQTKVLTNLQDIKAKPEMQNKRIEQVIPLVAVYMKSLHTIAPDFSALKGTKPIALNVKASAVMDIFQLMTDATAERAA